MLGRLRKAFRAVKPSMRLKLTLSLSAIVVILLVSSAISIMEYRSMSNYVTELIAGNIRSVNIAQRLSGSADSYNLAILTAMGDTSDVEMPSYDEDSFMAGCDSLRGILVERGMGHLVDSVEYAYSAYVLTSLELPSVVGSSKGARSWYVGRLQPVYDRLRSSIDEIADDVHSELRKNSGTFQRGFYRSIIPGMVAVLVGVLLVFMLFFFLMVFYVNPVYRMLSGLDNYKAVGKKYNVTFEGDDQLHDLNDGIADVTEENSQLRRRLKNLRQSISQQKPENEP